MNAGVSHAAVREREHAAARGAVAACTSNFKRRAARRERLRIGGDEHRVTVAEEAVALAHRVRIGREHALAARESRDQHQQRGLRQVEVRQQRIDHAEAESRQDEDVGLPGHGGQRAGSRCGFQCADHGGAHGDDAPATRRAAGTSSTTSGGTSTTSACMRCARRSSVRTGWKVPAPTCSVSVVVATPRARRASNMAVSKCSPAVGAATAPGARANTVW